MSWHRALAVWVLIVIAESLHGIIRQLFIAPVLGDLPARQIGVLTGSIIIFAITWLGIRWIGACTLKEQLATGFVWVILIAAFEFTLGTALGLTRERMLADYDLSNGGLMGAGLFFMLLAPALAAKLRGTAAHSPGR